MPGKHFVFGQTAVLPFERKLKVFFYLFSLCKLDNVPLYETVSLILSSKSSEMLLNVCKKQIELIKAPRCMTKCHKNSWMYTTDKLVWLWLYIFLLYTKCPVETLGLSGCLFSKFFWESRTLSVYQICLFLNMDLTRHPQMAVWCYSQRCILWS